MRKRSISHVGFFDEGWKEESAEPRRHFAVVHATHKKKGGTNEIFRDDLIANISLWFSKIDKQVVIGRFAIQCSY
jgi:hypothetical protein